MVEMVAPLAMDRPLSAPNHLGNKFRGSVNAMIDLYQLGKDKSFERLVALKNRATIIERFHSFTHASERAGERR